jgi:putative spermidine/putrescine transport system substrate-binding protein
MSELTITRRFLGLSALAGALPGVRRAAAQGTGKVVVATWGGGVGDTWRKAFGEPFQAQSGIPVTINEVADPSAQIRAQAASPQYNALVGTFSDAVNLHREGLIETLDPAAFPRVQATSAKYRLTAPDGRLLGVPVYFQFYGIAVNTDLVKPGQITSWKDLAAPRWKGQLAITRPVYASIYDLTIYAYVEGGDERNIEPGLPLYKQIAANAMTVYSSMAQLNQLLARGEVSAAPYYLTRVWAMKRQGLPVDIVIPKEGALINPYIAMIPKGSFDQAAAGRFLDYLSAPEPQSKMTDLTGYLPLSASATLTSAQETMLGMSLDALKAKLIQPDWFVIANEQQKRADITEQLVAQVR